MFSFSHLSLRALVPLADGETIPSHSAREHLASCAECRSQLQELRALAHSARTLGSPTPAADLLECVHARLDAGERVILPAFPSSTKTPAIRRSSVIIAATAMIAVATALWIARPVREAQAGETSGVLEFYPAAPARGATIHVRFHAPARLSREQTLQLRARYRTRHDESYDWGTSQRTVATLRGGSDGVYEGDLTLPDSIVYAVFAVEDPAGRQVDDHDRALWELLVHGPDGRPTYDALWQRECDLIGRNMELAVATARRIAQLYPGQPDAWASLYAIESYNLGESQKRTLEYRARLDSMHKRWSTDSNPPFAIVNGLLGYAAQVTDRNDPLGREVRDRWNPLRDRVTRDDPTDPDAVQARWWRLNAVAMKGRDSARVALALAERFWTGAGRGDRVGAMVGLQIARMAGDTSDVRLRWADRRVAATPAAADGVYREIGSERALRPAAIQRLEALAARLLVPDDSRRALESSRAQAAAIDSARARWVFATLGGLHLAEQDSAAAREAFSRATTTGWDLELLRRAAPALLATGDTAGAITVAARLAADPGTAAPTVDSLARRGSAIIGEARWTSLVAEQRKVMRAHFLAAATRTMLPRDIALLDAAGHPTTLQHLTRGRVNVVTFWSRHCAPSRQEMSRLGDLRARLDERGITLVPITVEPPSSDVADYLTKNPVGAPVYFDATSAARRAFGQWSTPEYYVLDAHGVVRFEHSTIDLVLAQAVSLGEE